MTTARKFLVVLTVGAMVGAVGPAGAQCPMDWAEGFNVPGTNGSVYAMTVFDDGSGPALYARADFSLAGGVAAHSVAKWNGSNWSAVGGGISAYVRALAVFDDGTGPALYAGGIGANYVARWDRSEWSALGGGAHSTVQALGVD